MQIINTIGLITINETLLVQVASFLVFMFVINRIMFRPLRRAVSERGAYRESIQQDIVERRNELVSLENRIREDQAVVRREAAALRRQLEDAGSQEAVQIFADTKQQIEALKEKAARRIADQVAAAKKEMQRESEMLVADIIEKVLERRPAQ